MIKFLNKTINSMNIPFTIRIALKNSDSQADNIMIDTYERMNRYLEQMDLKFSPFRENSLVSKFQRGNREPLLNSEVFESVYSKTVIIGELSNGSFDVYFNGDPTRLIKSYTIERAFDKFLVPLFDYDNIVGISLEGDGDTKFAVRPSTDFEWELGTSLETYNLRYGAISTVEINGREKYLKKDELDAIQSIAIVGDNLIDTNIWANVGLASGTNKFVNLIENSYLSGMLIDNEESITFAEGILNRNNHAEEVKIK
ncbi:FAD:protein FMN transferase [Companilactobacillus allii]|uniref:FAD:protein FMN transferase n=1 Tax=Companilactobacillus allii TaxID=1847728 RepID=A0A1P8Q0N0_9LACO|nr:hypothetical protein [Companilactobacillus allii]APX71381.1 hypothetical protein BTM29_01900 [Companilactobacillus allii]USQ68461.1 FAD:protein FMN transferase [Companilactobacillus allii]